MKDGESKDKSEVTEFYELLKSKIVGRVINGVIDGCILEKELEEIYDQYQRLRSDI